MHILPLHLIVEFALLGSACLLPFAAVYWLKTRQARHTEDQWFDRVMKGNK